jgi:hypothetical protein
MLTFLINNPERFACDLLIWPAVVTMTKVVTAIGAQAAALIYMMYQTNEITIIKFYAGATVIASLDEKLNGMITNMHSSELAGKTIEDLPLEIGVYQYQSSFEAMKNVWARYFFKEDTSEDKDGKKKSTSKAASRISFIDALIITIAAILNQITYLFYITVYFYYGAFYPFIALLIASNSARHTPCLTAALRTK